MKNLRRLLQKFRVFLSFVIANLINVPFGSSYSTKVGLKAIILHRLISKVLRYPGPRFSSRSTANALLNRLTVYENLLPLLLRAVTPTLLAREAVLDVKANYLEFRP